MRLGKNPRLVAENREFDKTGEEEEHEKRFAQNHESFELEALSRRLEVVLRQNPRFHQPPNSSADNHRLHFTSNRLFIIFIEQLDSSINFL